MDDNINSAPVHTDRCCVYLPFSKQVITDKTYSHAKQIEDQIIHIKAAQQRKQLQHLHQEHHTQAGTEETEEVSKLRIDPGQQPADGNEQEDISDQIDDTVHQRAVVGAVIDHLPVIADGEKGNQIDISVQLIFIGNTLSPTGTAEEQQPDHKGAVQPKEELQPLCSVCFGFCHHLPLRFPGAGFLEAMGALRAGFPLEAGFAGGLDGKARPLGRGGTARIRHLGPEPIRSSRWAFSSASRTR